MSASREIVHHVRHVEHVPLTEAAAIARALPEINGIRSDIGLPPLEQLVPAPIDEASDEPLDAHPCPVTLSILSGAPEGWTCVWTGWDRIDITGPEVDVIRMVVPNCVDLQIMWGRGDVPTLALAPPPLVPYTTRPRFGEQLTLGVAA